MRQLSARRVLMGGIWVPSSWAEASLYTGMLVPVILGAGSE